MAFSWFSCLRLFFDERKVRQPLTALWYKRRRELLRNPHHDETGKVTWSWGVDRPPFEDDMVYSDPSSANVMFCIICSKSMCVSDSLVQRVNPGTPWRKWNEDHGRPLLVMDESCEQQESTGETGWWDALCVCVSECSVSDVSWRCPSGCCQVVPVESWWRKGWCGLASCC